MNLLTRILPDSLWRQTFALRVMELVAGRMLRTDRLRLSGQAPNGQWFVANPPLVWSIPESRAVLDGNDLGRVGPAPEQARLGDFWLPQCGLFVIGRAFFEPFDPARHCAVAARAERSR